MRRSCLAIVLILALTGCDLFKQEWTAYVYPDKSDLRNSTTVGTFSSKEEARRAALAALERMHALESGDYELGLNCKRSGYGTNLCKETSR